MLKVYAAGDKVLIDLCGRRRDVLLSPLEAVQFADMLDDRAAWAEQAEPELVKGEQWDCHVRSYGGRVVVRFYSPELGLPERVPMPAGAARQLAEVLRANARAAALSFALRPAMLRSAQLTPFLTKFRPSAAARSMRGRQSTIVSSLTLSSCNATHANSANAARL